MTRRAGAAPRALAHLVLADGTVFEGEDAGAAPEGGIATGEAVFNTVLSGYQEVITDPSYAGQVIAFTYPHIGNYGVNPTDDEAPRPHCRGVVVRDLAERPSSWRSAGDLETYLVAHGIPAITGVDTRRLTRHLRSHGSVPCAFGTAPVADLAEAARTAPSTDGQDLVSTVTTPEIVVRGEGPYRVVAYDFGIKTSILRQLELAGVQIEVVPASTSAADVLAREPDGVFLSNGPGDPAAVTGAITTVQQLLGAVPMFGICLGHQIMSLALGAKTFKLPFGHHGGNHPVRRVADGRVEITSQNHNYAVDSATLPSGSIVSHVNLNDGDVEGVRSDSVRAFSVQYHPEAGPGPHDARYLFEEFTTLMREAG